MESRKYKLGKIADFNKICIGKDDTFSTIEYLDTSSITENVISGTSILNISDAPSRAQRKVTDKTIIYSTVRPRLRHYGILRSPKNNLIVSTGFVTIDIKEKYEKEIDARYLYLLLTQPSITEYVGNIADTAVSAYPSINPSDIASITFIFPDIEVQRNIADIWENLHQKIALNHAINDNLVGEGIIFYQGSTDFGIRFPDIRQYTTAPSRYANKGDILMSVRAPVGALNIANNDCCIGRGLSALSSKVGSMTHLYYTMNYFRLRFEDMNSAGTTFGSITKDELYGLPIILPAHDVLLSFEKICAPIYDKQMEIGEETESLTKQRDELLPLLMNGQTSVNYHLFGKCPSFALKTSTSDEHPPSISANQIFFK